MRLATVSGRPPVSADECECVRARERVCVCVRISFGVLIKRSVRAMATHLSRDAVAYVHKRARSRAARLR